MVKNNLIVISFGLSWNWPADYEKQTALQLAKKNTVIAFLMGEGFTFKNYLNSIIKGQKKFLIKKNKRDLFKFTPFYLFPFQRIKVIQKINFFLSVWQLRFLIWLKEEWRKKDKILWLFTSQLSLLPSYFGQDFFPLYDCIDLASSLDKEEVREKKKKEEEIIRQVKIVFATSHSLYILHKELHPKVYFVSQGFDCELFSKSKKFPEPKDLAKIPPPRIGLVGNISYRFNFHLIRMLVISNPKFSFVLIGPFDPDPKQDTIVNTQKNLKVLTRLGNIYFLGRKLKEKIPSYIHHLDFGFIPYDTNQEFNRFCFPMKVFEYFYMGKPVISTPIEELKRLKPYVTIVNDAKQAKKAIEKILKHGWPENYKKEQKKLAIANSWKAKIEKISQILKKEFPQEF